MDDNKITIMSEATIQHEGLDQIEKLRPSFSSDMFSRDNEIIGKLNEVIEKVNLLMALKNSEIPK